MDTLSPTQRSERMSRIKARDTKPEMVVRRMLHGLRYRFRLHRRDLPGSPDLVFPSRKKAIFVHGCFWHRHADPTCPLARMPKTRVEFWEAKLEGNRLRDLRKQEALTEAGWTFALAWECELRHEEQLKNKLCMFLDGGGEVEGR